MPENKEIEKLIGNEIGDHVNIKDINGKRFACILKCELIDEIKPDRRATNFSISQLKSKSKNCVKRGKNLTSPAKPIVKLMSTSTEASTTSITLGLEVSTNSIPSSLQPTLLSTTLETISTTLEHSTAMPGIKIQNIHFIFSAFHLFQNLQNRNYSCQSSYNYFFTNRRDNRTAI